MTHRSDRPGTSPIANVLTESRIDFEDFEYVRRLLLDEAAIELEVGKEYLAEARLDALASLEGFASASALVARLKIGDPGDLRSKTVSAMTQNETSFFRDIRPFQELQHVILPDLIAKQARKRRLRIWSSACSSGQEPYSLALLIRKHFPELADWDVSILASDLSEEMVNRARRGRYSQGEVNRGLPSSFLIESFHRNGLEWTINEATRRLVDFRTINLIGDWPEASEFDLVALRNVLIYLKIDARKAILERMARVIAPGGYLWLGQAESTINLDSDNRFDRLEPERGSIYRLRDR